MGLKKNAVALWVGCLAMSASFADSARILKIEPRTMAVQASEMLEDADNCDTEAGEYSRTGGWSAIFAAPARSPRTVTVYDVTYDYSGRVMRDTLSYVPINDVEVDKVGRARRLPYDNRP